MSAEQSVKGFTLVEVMVASVILAIGILGLLALQVKLYALTREADAMTHVALHTANLAENMRANPIRAIDSSGTLTLRYTHYVLSGSAVPVTQPNQSERMQAIQDLQQFHQQLVSDLNLAKGEVYTAVCHARPTGKMPTPNDMGCSDDPEDPVMIKVAWLVAVHPQEAEAASSTVADRLSYGYQFRVN